MSNLSPNWTETDQQGGVDSPDAHRQFGRPARSPAPRRSNRPYPSPPPGAPLVDSLECPPWPARPSALRAWPRGTQGCGGPLSGAWVIAPDGGLPHPADPSPLPSTTALLVPTPQPCWRPREAPASVPDQPRQVPPEPRIRLRHHLRRPDRDPRPPQPHERHRHGDPMVAVGIGTDGHRRSRRRPFGPDV